MNQNSMPESLPAGAVVGILVVYAIFFLVALAILLGICYVLYVCFNRIPAEHRQMEPWQVWLLLIPCFPLVWNFFVYPKLAKSYQSYFHSVGRTDVGDCGEKLGFWFALATVGSLVPLVNFIAGPASLILMIIFLIKAWSLQGQIGEVKAI